MSNRPFDEKGLFTRIILTNSHLSSIRCAYADGTVTAEQMILSAYARGIGKIIPTP